jgi:hypothetical protein
MVQKIIKQNKRGLWIFVYVLVDYKNNIMYIGKNYANTKIYQTLLQNEIKTKTKIQKHYAFIFA